MIHVDARFEEAVETTVTRIETLTDAELVVVAAERSGAYRDLALILGGALALAGLCVALFSPWHVAPTWLPLELLALSAGGAWAANRSPRALRLLSREARRHAQVDEAAAAAFVQEQVHGTRRRTGLLVYISALEGEVRVLPDHGLEGLVPPAAWNRVRWDISELDRFLEGLEAIGAVLADGLQAQGDDNPDELPNAPRIRP
ncbi:MAG: hypothetical protein H6741_03065 [Alphaproteobacteria bacterium]|nr:hypothetical protein [Alphaproteobacteria bacterium]